MEFGKTLWAGEIAASVSTRRFYIGELVNEGQVAVTLKYAMVMDELRSKDGINYMMMPDPVLFSESEISFYTAKFINAKTLNKIHDSTLIAQYEENVKRYRLENSGLVSSSSDRKNLHPIMG